jgi:hypothetical protein
MLNAAKGLMHQRSSPAKDHPRVKAIHPVRLKREEPGRKIRINEPKLRNISTCQRKLPKKIVAKKLVKD